MKNSFFTIAIRRLVSEAKLIKEIQNEIYAHRKLKTKLLAQTLQFLRNTFLVGKIW